MSRQKRLEIDMGLSKDEKALRLGNYQALVKSYEAKVLRQEKALAESRKALAAAREIVEQLLV